MHVSPAKHSYVWLPRKCDYPTDRQTPDKVIQSDPYVPLCFTGGTKRGEIIGTLQLQLFALESGIRVVRRKNRSPGQQPSLHSSQNNFFQKSNFKVKVIIYGTMWMVLSQKNTHVQYESSICSGFKVIAKVKVFQMKVILQWSRSQGQKLWYHVTGLVTSNNRRYIALVADTALSNNLT